MGAAQMPEFSLHQPEVIRRRLLRSVGGVDPFGVRFEQELVVGGVRLNPVRGVRILVSESVKIVEGLLRSVGLETILCVKFSLLRPKYQIKFTAVIKIGFLYFFPALWP
jgi:hypothetical protein